MARRVPRAKTTNKNSKIMKQLVKTIALITLTSTLAAISVEGQANKLVTVNELGNGTYAGNPLPSAIGVDPFSGIAGLRYTLPFAGSRGDVVMLEPGPAPQQFTDIIRFDGNGSMFFFSERETSDLPPFDPADVSQFPGLIAGFPTIFIQEIGPEGNNGAFYVPNPGDPGFEPTVGNVAYNFISDVPEPTSGMLLLLGLGSLAIRKALRKNNQAQN
jgi:hypothetical protein